MRLRHAAILPCQTGPHAASLTLGDRAPAGRAGGGRDLVLRPLRAGAGRRDGHRADRNPGRRDLATVSYVHDGDTLFLDAGAGDLKVRLIGIDSPELADDDTAQECYGPEAAAALRNLLPEGVSVWTVHDREAQDQYGRELLYVFTEDGTLVNRAMVLAGAAEAIRIGQNDHYWPQLQDAQRDAETAGAGMWAVC